MTLCQAASILSIRCLIALYQSDGRRHQFEQSLSVLLSAGDLRQFGWPGCFGSPLRSSRGEHWSGLVPHTSACLLSKPCLLAVPVRLSMLSLSYTLSTPRFHLACRLCRHNSVSVVHACVMGGSLSFDMFDMLSFLSHAGHSLSSVSLALRRQ